MECAEQSWFFDVWLESSWIHLITLSVEIVTLKEKWNYVSMENVYQIKTNYFHEKLIRAYPHRTSAAAANAGLYIGWRLKIDPPIPKRHHRPALAAAALGVGMA